MSIDRKGVKELLIKKYGKDSYGVVSEAKGHPTGIPPLDRALGTGGFPQGRIVEIFGPESGGKTLVSLVAIACVQKEIKKPCAFFDLEYSLEDRWAKLLGVNLDMLDIWHKDCAEENLDMIRDMIESGVYAYIVVDSLVGLVPKKVIESDATAKKGESIAETAKVIKRGLRRIIPVLSRTETCLIFINHIIMKAGITFGNPETTPGGLALKFYASQRLRVSKVSNSDVKEGKQVIGHSVRVKVVKNKLAPPMKEAHFPIIYTEGVDVDTLIVDEALELKIVEKKGNTYYFDGEKIAVGYEKYIDVLEEDPTLFEEIVAKVKETY